MVYGFLHDYIWYIFVVYILDRKSTPKVLFHEQKQIMRNTIHASSLNNLPQGSPELSPNEAQLPCFVPNQNKLIIANMYLWEIKTISKKTLESNIHSGVVMLKWSRLKWFVGWMGPCLVQTFSHKNGAVVAFACSQSWKSSVFRLISLRSFIGAIPNLSIRMSKDQCVWPYDKRGNYYSCIVRQSCWNHSL